MKPGDIVTWNYRSRGFNLYREKRFGPGPYSIIRKGLTFRDAGPTWKLSRLLDGYEIPMMSFAESNLKILTFLTAAREAIHETEV